MVIDTPIPGAKSDLPAAPPGHTILTEPPKPGMPGCMPGTQLLRCQYLHFYTSKASKVSTWYRYCHA